jgi:hypothetical protein
MVVSFHSGVEEMGERSKLTVQMREIERGPRRRSSGSSGLAMKGVGEPGAAPGLHWCLQLRRFGLLGLGLIGSRATLRWPARQPMDLARWALAIAVTVATLALPAYVFLVLNDGMKHHTGFGDEGYFVWCGWSVLKGLAPYRDSLEFKPPLVFLTHALALKLHGFAGYQYRQFFTYFPLTSILALQLSLLSRRVDKVLAMGLSLALIQVWVMPAFHDTALSDTESIGLTYYFLGVALLLARTRWPAAMQVLGAAFLFFCTQSKEPFLPCAGCTWVACFFASPRTGSFRSESLRYLKYSAIGAGGVVVGLCLYMVPSGSMSAYITMVRRYTVVYRDPTQSFCVMGGVFQPTTPFNDLLRQGQALVNNYANLPRMGFLIPFAAASVIFLWRRSVLLALVTAVTCLTAFVAVAASNCPWFHYYNMLLSGLFFALAVGLDAMTPAFRRAGRATRVLIRFAMLTPLFLIVWPRVDAEREAFGTRGVASPFVEPFPGVFEAVRKYTTPTDRIVTSGNPILYVQTDRLNGLRESNLLDPILGFYVGTSDEEKLRPLYEELEKSRPKLLILDPSYAHARPRHQRALWGPFLEKHPYTKLSPNIYLRAD